MHAKLFAKQACQLPRYYFYFDIISKHYTYIYESLKFTFVILNASLWATLFLDLLKS